jgi:glycosyltransferase involved in cell wall biosynthesis
MPSRPLRVAMLVVDDRRDPRVGTPTLGAAPTALLQGFADLGPDHIEVHVVSCIKHRGLTTSKLAPNIWYHPLLVPSWAFLRTLHLGPSVTVRRFLRKEIKPDVVHSQGIEWWCGVAGALSGYPSLLTIHGNIRAILANSILKPRAFWKLQALLGDFAIWRHSGVVCISEHVRKNIALKARETWLIPNALRKEFLQRQTVTAQRSGRPLLLVVGTITENKRPLEILEVLFALHAEGLQFEVTFIGYTGGSGCYEQQFTARLREATRLGFARHKENLNAFALAKEMAQADAVIHCPREEAFGLVVTEAISQGMTVFASRVGGLTEICYSNPGCILVEPHDVGGLRAALKQWLASHPERTARLLPEDYISSYHPVTVAQSTLQAYHEVIARSPVAVKSGMQLD